jgi:ketose-bisphosphate aldolase
MIDASSRPFDDNLAVTRQVVEMAGPADVSVEAELGEIGGVEDDKSVADADARLADPAKAESFSRRVSIDCLAPAIGTAHGIYKGEPRIAFDRLAEISRRVSLPLALHGGTGLAPEVFRECIRLGCAKVNISTQLKHTFIDSFVAHHADHLEQYEPLKGLGVQYDRLKQDVKCFIELFGSHAKG